MKTITIDFDLYKKEMHTALQGGRHEVRQGLIEYLKTGQKFDEYFDVDKFHEIDPIKFWIEFLKLIGREEEVPECFKQKLSNYE